MDESVIKDKMDESVVKVFVTSMLQNTENGVRVYSYDQCFGPNSTNVEIYEKVGKPVVSKVLEGYNGTVLNYGQTGSGKTHTVKGYGRDPGLMMSCVREMLSWRMLNCSVNRCIIRVSCIEIYNEEINDLLGNFDQSSRNLKIVSEEKEGFAVGKSIYFVFFKQHFKIRIQGD